MFGNFRTQKFSDVYPKVEAFLDDYVDNGIPTTISSESANTLYYLLYAKYGNSTMSNFDVNQFKYRLFSIIFQFGPTWEKELQIQEDLRSLTKEQLLEGSKAIYNHAYNPNTTPLENQPEELTYINEQNTTKYKKGVLDGYMLLQSMLEADVTGRFISKFKDLFIKIVEPYSPLWYVSDIEEEI